MSSLIQSYFRNAFLVASSLIAGCAISSPQRVPPLAIGETGNDTVFVVVTRADIKPALRSTFDDVAARVVKALPQQPGLITYSLRREIFGTQEWTMTAWSSAEAREAFGSSLAHREAMKLTSILVKDLDVQRFTIRRDQLPLPWTDALARLSVAKTARASGNATHLERKD